MRDQNTCRTDFVHDHEFVLQLYDYQTFPTSLLPSNTDVGCLSGRVSHTIIVSRSLSICVCVCVWTRSPSSIHTTQDANKCIALECNLWFFLAWEVITECVVCACVCVVVRWQASVVLHETTRLTEKRIFFWTNLFILLGNVPCSEMQIESIWVWLLKTFKWDLIRSRGAEF